MHEFNYLKMKIEDYNLYKNKTWNLLVPCLISHGRDLIIRLNNMVILGVGVHDTLLDGSPNIKGNNIYLLIQKDCFPFVVAEFASWIQTKPYYVSDYCPDSNIFTSNKHMFILNVPEIHNDAYFHFLKGEYSKMYSPEYISRNIKPEHAGYKILTKDPSLIPNLIQELESNFSVKGSMNLDPDEFIGKEVSMPLKKIEEIFNYTEDSSVFFSEELYKNWHK